MAARQARSGAALMSAPLVLLVATTLLLTARPCAAQTNVTVTNVTLDASCTFDDSPTVPSCTTSTATTSTLYRPGNLHYSDFTTQYPSFQYVWQLTNVTIQYTFSGNLSLCTGWFRYTDVLALIISKNGTFACSSAIEPPLRIVINTNTNTSQTLSTTSQTTTMLSTATYPMLVWMVLLESASAPSVNITYWTPNPSNPAARVAVSPNIITTPPPPPGPPRPPPPPPSPHQGASQVRASVAQAALAAAAVLLVVLCTEWL